MYSALKLAVLPPLYFSISDKSLALFLCCLVTLIRFYFQEKCCLHIVQTYLKNRKMLCFLIVQSNLLLNCRLNSFPPILLAFLYNFTFFSLLRIEFFSKSFVIFAFLHHILCTFYSLCIGYFNNFSYTEFIS